MKEIILTQKVLKKKLIYFGYTYCPDICPMDVLKISQVYDLNNDLKNELLPIFITVDPERDDQNTVRNFIENFNDAFIGLTGTTKEINEVIKASRFMLITIKKMKRIIPI